MPAKAKGARLYLKPAEYDKTTGKLRKSAVWIIKDGYGQSPVVTGCAEADRSGAEVALAAYLDVEAMKVVHPGQSCEAE
ncbi:hypothetical protein KC217_22800, partial [Mycobacterium tuberculosis]|nr:hypothetical protein [Mycobacterium tuberculosis]